MDHVSERPRQRGSALIDKPSVRRWAEPSRRTATLTCVVTGILGTLFAAYPLTLPHMLAGVHGFASGAGYDDGVYLAVAVRFVHGTLPYRDFVFVHPPGIAWLLAPVAAVGRLVGTRDALVLARIVTVLVAGCNCALAGYAVRHRGTAASVTAGVLLAGFPGAYNADHTLLLEPWLVFFCLVGFVLLFSDGRLATAPPRLVTAGLLLGFAGTVKLWAALVVLPLLVLAVAVRRRRARPFVAGVTAGFVVPCLPFLLVAPGAFVRDVFVAQADRSAAGVPLGVRTRLGIMSGLEHFAGTPTSLPIVAFAVGALAAVVAVLAVCRRGAALADWAAAAATAVVVGGIFLPGQFYDHYAYFPAAFAAVLVGCCVGLVSRRPVPSGAHADGRTDRRATAVAASVALPALAVVAVVLAVPRGVGGARAMFADAADPSAVIASAVPEGSCVLSEDPILLLAANRFVTKPGCPALVDPFGLWLTDAQSLPHLGGPYPPAFVAEWTRWFQQADYVVLSVRGSSYVPFSPELAAAFDVNYVEVSAGNHAYIHARIR